MSALFIVVTFSVLLDGACFVAFVGGMCSPWIARNVRRLNTLLSVVYVTVETNLLVRVCFTLSALCGVFYWNRPKDKDDDDDDKKKRRVEKEEASGLSWREAASWGNALVLRVTLNESSNWPSNLSEK